MFATNEIRLFATAFMLLAVAMTLASCHQTAKDVPTTEPTMEIAQSHPEYAGRYVSDYDSSELDIKLREDGQYDIEVSLTRLTLLDDGIGALVRDSIYFRATDAGGEPIYGTIGFNDSTATLTFTHSLWTYIKGGDSYTFRRTEP